MSRRESSSLILQNLKKRDLQRRGEPVVPLEEAEHRLAAAAAPAVDDAAYTSLPDSMLAISHEKSAAPEPASGRTRLRPRERAARSALIVRLSPELHRRLEEVARFNRLSMNDIVIEAIEFHLQDFPHPPGAGQPA